jgi:hypothetical protein
MDGHSAKIRYYDQMHMIHDFTEFTGETPTGILIELETVFADRIRTVQSGGNSEAVDGNSRLIL